MSWEISWGESCWGEVSGVKCLGVKYADPVKQMVMK